ncbi:MAG: OsmC family protein [Bacteroidota bacterium]
MEKLHVQYTKNLQTKLTHERSGSIIYTEAPVDNEGSGSSFSPTDLCASSLGACILTIIGIAAKKHHFSIEGASVSIAKIMADNPRRIGELVLNFDFSGLQLGEKEQRIIEHAISNCPVALSLHPDIVRTNHVTY